MPQVSRYPLSKDIEKRVKEIFLQSISGLKGKELTQFLDDLLTSTEKTMLIKRIAIAFLLMKNYNYKAICGLLNVSSATVFKAKESLNSKDEGLKKRLEKILKNERLIGMFDKIDEFFEKINPPPVKRDWSSWRKKQWKRQSERRKPF